MPEPKYNREDYLMTGSSSNAITDLSSHLEELRSRIIIAILSLLTCIAVSFYFSDSLIRILLKAVPEGAKFFQLKPGELFVSSLKVSIYAGLILSSPILLKQLGLFLQPALKDKEQKILNPIINLAPILFCSGIAFAYFFILPALLKFFLGFHQDLVEQLYGLEHLLNLELAILMISGLSFELPIAILSLGYLGLINKSILLKHWRYAVMIALCLAAILTPTPDPISMSVLGLALLFLYFASAMLL
jgi:sec-independent protein translocase protein TatC